MISKELLSKILGYEATEIYKVDNTLLYYETSDMAIHMKFSPYKCNINVHELAHKCKKWAWDNTRSFYKKYYGNIGSISSGVTYQNKFYCEIGYGSGEDETFEADSEPEAIFKACQWILDNKGRL